MNDTRRAAVFAAALPALLLAGAYASEAVGLIPCEMCWWQRWAHFAALAAALPACFLQIPSVRNLAPHSRIDAATRFWTVLAALCIFTSGIIGAYHAGIEYGWWEGHTACTATTTGAVTLESIIKQPLVRCDRAQWTLFGISLAGYNAVVSTLGAVAVMLLVRRAGRDA
jgi:disulfide bond formation protein DsbB